MDAVIVVTVASWVRTTNPHSEPSWSAGTFSAVPPNYSTMGIHAPSIRLRTRWFMSVS